MKTTQVTGFILLGLVAVSTTIHFGYVALLPAASAFLSGMYFGTLLGGSKKEE